MVDDGYVNIVGRIKDMIIRGGESIYPREIEEFLHTHRGIAHVQVVGVLDQRYGEEIMAWISTTNGATIDTDAVSYCHGKIAHYNTPGYVATAREFPVGAVGDPLEHAVLDEPRAAGQ